MSNNEVIVINSELKKQVAYSVTEETLKALKQEVSLLKVIDVNDKAGYTSCKSKRMQIVKLRTGLDVERVKIKAEAQAFVSYVDSQARTIKTSLEAMEEQLKSQENIVDAEIARKKQEFEENQKRKQAERATILKQFKYVISIEDLEALTNMSDEEFTALSAKAESEFKKQIEVEEQAKKEREAEALKMKQLEAENKKKEAELKSAQDKIAEMQRIQNEEAKKRLEATAKIEREKAQAQEKLRLEAESNAKIEQQKLQAKIDAQRQKTEDEEKTRLLREAQLQKQVKDKTRLEEIKKNFPTLEQAWLKIFDLTKNA